MCANDIQLPKPVPDTPIEELMDEEFKLASAWGEVWLARSHPWPGHAWTDDGGAGESSAEAA